MNYGADYKHREKMIEKADADMRYAQAEKEAQASKHAPEASKEPEGKAEATKEDKKPKKKAWFPGYEAGMAPDAWVSCGVRCNNEDLQVP